MCGLSSAGLMCHASPLRVDPRQPHCQCPIDVFAGALPCAGYVPSMLSDLAESGRRDLGLRLWI